MTKSNILSEIDKIKKDEKLMEMLDELNRK